VKTLKKYNGKIAEPNCITCRHCGMEIKQNIHSYWVHIFNSDTRCNLVWENDSRLGSEKGDE
jgi:hypothetical protein